MEKIIESLLKNKDMSKDNTNHKLLTPDLREGTKELPLITVSVSGNACLRCE